MTRSWPNLFLAAYVALIGALLFATPAHAAHCRGANGRFIKCPPTPVPIPTPAPAPVPTPTPVPVTWVAAPLTVGGYACSKVQAADPRSGPCGSGIVYRLTGSMMSADAVPVPQYAAVFFADASGNFPAGDVYEVSFIGYWQASDLIGIAPGQ